MAFVLVLYFYGVMIGACAASFAGVIGERGLSGALRGRSRCSCGEQLRARQLIPIVSWLAVRGRARCCGEKIPDRYVVAETFAGAATGLGVVFSISTGLGALAFSFFAVVVIFGRTSVRRV